MALYRTLHQYTEPLRIDYADQAWAPQKAYLDKLDNQRTFAEYLAYLSPSEVFRQMVSSLCRTDVSAHHLFMDKVREYREELIQYFIDEKIFASYEYFTRLDPETFMTADEIVRTRSGGDFQTLQEYREWARLNNGDFSPLYKVDIPGSNRTQYEPLDLSNVPQFHWEPVSVVNDLKKVFVRLAVLITAGIVLFYFSFVSFTRYDVR